MCHLNAVDLLIRFRHFSRSCSKNRKIQSTLRNEASARCDLKSNLEIPLTRPIETTTSRNQLINFVDSSETSIISVSCNAKSNSLSAKGIIIFDDEFPRFSTWRSILIGWHWFDGHRSFARAEMLTIIRMRTRKKSQKVLYVLCSVVRWKECLGNNSWVK